MDDPTGYGHVLAIGFRPDPGVGPNRAGMRLGKGARTGDADSTKARRDESPWRKGPNSSGAVLISAR